ncbi:uncharacterized protein LOC124424049 [Vespa crabro]|uniref:uncharacterized protein LOC124424049 n=1 Tax=Vespa crabro TaxID=7445 RepID=UPI001EFFF88B|nr:uncharacterized protein LOC124424049 [Vespa crabro]
MEIKLLRVLIYIKFLFLLSIVAHAEEENFTKFKIQTFTNDPLRTALFKIQSNANYLRELFAENRENYLEIIAAIQTENKSDRKLLLIMQLIEEIVHSIEECTVQIYNARSNVKSRTFSMSDDIINAWYTILENVSFFGDLFVHFPDMVTKILRFEKKWIEILLLSAQYTDVIENLVDESTYATISLAKKELSKIKKKFGKKYYLSNKKKSKKNLSKFIKLEL